MAAEKCKGSHCGRFAQKGKELCERCEEVLRVNVPLRDIPGRLTASLKLPSTWKFHDREEEELRDELHKVMDRAKSMAREKGVAEADMPEKFTSVWNTMSAHEAVYDL